MTEGGGGGVDWWVCMLVGRLLVLRYVGRLLDR